MDVGVVLVREWRLKKNNPGVDGASDEWSRAFRIRPLRRSDSGGRPWQGWRAVERHHRVNPGTSFNQVRRRKTVSDATQLTAFRLQRKAAGSPSPSVSLQRRFPRVNPISPEPLCISLSSNTNLHSTSNALHLVQCVGISGSETGKFHWVS